jgi:hypothetical protein
MGLPHSFALSVRVRSKKYHFMHLLHKLPFWSLIRLRIENYFR